MATRLDLTPWARAKLTPAQRVALVKRAAELGADRLHISARSSKGPFVASLSGGGFSGMDRVIDGIAWNAADRLLTSHEVTA